MRGAARIFQVVVFIDQITSHLSTVISNKTNGYPAALKNSCRAGIQFDKQVLHAYRLLAALPGCHG
jgi:hypothetical protein